ncbi:MAG: TolC family protein, partial [Deferribacterales bacterium]
MMRLLSLIVFLLFTINLYALQLTFEEAKNMLLEKNNIIKSYKEETEASKYRFSQAQGHFFPKVDISETFVSSNEPGTAAFSKIAQGKFDMPYFMTKMADPNYVKNFETKIEIIQPILMQGKIYYGTKQAESSYKASLSILDGVKQEMIYNLVRAYYGKALAEKGVEVTEKSLERTKRYKAMTEDFYRNGLIVKSDLLVADSRLSLNEAFLSDAKKQLELSNSFLQRLLDIDEHIAIVWNDLGLNVDKDLDEYIKLAFENRQDLKAMESYLKVYEFENKKSKMSYWPEIAAFANYKMNDENLFGDSGKGFTIGAMVKFNIFSGFSDQNKISESKSNYLSFNYKLMDKKNEIKSEVKDAYYSVIAAQKKVESHKKSLEAAYSALQITENRFKEGLT